MNMARYSQTHLQGKKQGKSSEIHVALGVEAVCLKLSRDADIHSFEMSLMGFFCQLVSAIPCIYSGDIVIADEMTLNQ